MKIKKSELKELVESIVLETLNEEEETKEHTHTWKPIPNETARYKCDGCGKTGKKNMKSGEIKNTKEPEKKPVDAKPKNNDPHLTHNLQGNYRVPPRTSSSGPDVTRWRRREAGKVNESTKPSQMIRQLVKEEIESVLKEVNWKGMALGAGLAAAGLGAGAVRSGMDQHAHLASVDQANSMHSVAEVLDSNVQPIAKLARIVSLMDEEGKEEVGRQLQKNMPKFLQLRDQTYQSNQAGHYIRAIERVLQGLESTDYQNDTQSVATQRRGPYPR